MLEGDFYQTSTAAPASCSPRATACPRHTSHAGHASHQTRLTSHVTHHTSRVTLHSQVTRHTSMDVTVTYPGYEPKFSVVFSLFRLCCKRHTTGSDSELMMSQPSRPGVGGGETVVPVFTWYVHLSFTHVTLVCPCDSRRGGDGSRCRRGGGSSAVTADAVTRH